MQVKVISLKHIGHAVFGLLTPIVAMINKINCRRLYRKAARQRKSGKERRNSLGLLNVKGFSEAVGQNVKTVFLQKNL